MGLGTQDSLAEAEDFVEDYGTRSFLMTWDPSGRSWAELGVTGQPAAMLFDANGNAIEGWYGSIPEEEVLSLAAKAS